MEVLLSRTAWHYRLQLFTFGEVPFTNNFCPYFWLTIFCLLVSPFTGGWAFLKWLAYVFFAVIHTLLEKPFEAIFTRVEKVFMWVLKTILSGISWLNQEIYNPYVERKIANLAPEKAFELYRKQTESISGRISKAESEVLSKWQEIHSDNWKEMLIEARNKFYQKIEEQAAKERQIEYEKLLRRAEQQQRAVVRRERRQKLYNIVIKVSKTIFLFLGGALVVSLVGALFYGGYLLVDTHGAVKILEYIGATLLVIFGIVVFVLVCFCLGKLIENWYKSWYKKMLILQASRPSEVERTPTAMDRANDKVVSFFSKLGALLGRVFNPVVEFYEFFYEYFKNFKKNHCPAIIWKSDAETPQN